jgi:hypothetical protein
MNNKKVSDDSFFARLSTGLACFLKALSSPGFSRQAAAILHGSPLAAPGTPQAQTAMPSEIKTGGRPGEKPVEKAHASGLFMLSLLQREGRLVDFLQEDLSSFSDADIGAAARVVHTGCRKVLAQCLTLEPVLKEPEGAAFTVPAGFDAQRIRLTGNVGNQPPFHGELKHRGWAVAALRLPTVSDTLDPRVIAPAEVEIP